MRTKFIDIALFVFLVASVSSKNYASSFFVPDSDSATLLQISMTLAKDFQTTLRLLEVAKDTQKVLGTVHDTIARKYYLAERIRYRIERLNKLKKLKPKTLQELNKAIALLKYNMNSIKQIYKSVGRELIQTEEDLEFIRMKTIAPSVQENRVEELVDNAHQSGVERNTSNIALNTAYSTRILHDINQSMNITSERELQKNKIEMNEYIRKLNEEEALRKWTGIDELIHLQAKNSDGFYGELENGI